MRKVIETVINLRLREAPMFAAVICAVARWVIIANDRSLLLENGSCIDLSMAWSHEVLYRFENLGQKMISRMITTTKIQIAPALLNELKLYFQCKIKKLKAWLEIPEYLVINSNQTPLPYVCTGKRKYHTQGASNVYSKKGKKANYRYPHNNYGKLLSMQLIYIGTSDRCLPKGSEFSNDWNVTCTANHWNSESKVI